MLGSSNHFFNQSAKALKIKRNEVYGLLRIKGYSKDAVAVYLKAYDYFCVNPSEFDGATLVKDLCDIPDLDIDAMLHDYHYVVYGVGSSFAMKWRADKLFAKGIEKKGKGEYPAWSRFTGLTVADLGWVAYARIKRGKMTIKQKESFMLDYKTLML